MVKRKNAAGWRRVIVGTGVVMGMLFLTIAVMSLLIQKAILRTDVIQIGLTACCVVSGITGAVYSGRGERGIRGLLTCLIPALAVLLIAILGVKEAESVTPVILHVSGLLLPSAISEAIAAGQHRKSGRKRKRSYMMKPRG